MLGSFVPDSYVFAMFARIFDRCWAAVVVFFFSITPLWAQDDAEKTQEWVISYFFLILFLTLTLLILLRPVKRDDSAFTFDELQAQKEEEMKKIKGTR
jgi:hypothetical protein